MTGAALSLDDVYGAMLAEFESAVGDAHEETAPLWTPRPIQPDGTRITLPDGRVLSPQEAALESPADELFFGGQPAGGKSDLLLGAAITKHRASAIFRRQRAQFEGPGGLIERSREIIGIHGHFARNRWNQLPGGRAFEFCGCDHENDIDKYQGKSHDLKAFDELPQFPKKFYTHLVGWLRSKYEQRKRVISTGNVPRTEEGQWVLTYWGPWLDPTHPRPAQPGELRWFVVDDGKDREVPGPTYGTERPKPVKVRMVDGRERWVTPRSRTFIPAGLKDNPDLAKSGYADVLDGMPAELQALAAGDFAGAREDHPQQIIPTAWVLAAQQRWTPDGAGETPLSQVGNDVSRGGQDEFVIAKRYGNWIAPLECHDARKVPDGVVGASLLAASVGEADVPVAIDIIGPGSAVFDVARLLKLRVVAANGAAASKRRPKGYRGAGYANKRAEWHWTLREALDPARGDRVALPPDPQLRADLCALRWEMTLRGIKVEDKEEIKARLGRSPDRGEAVIYACANVAGAPYELLFDETAPAARQSVADELAALRTRLGIATNGSGVEDG